MPHTEPIPGYDPVERVELHSVCTERDHWRATVGEMEARYTVERAATMRLMDRLRESRKRARDENRRLREDNERLRAQCAHWRALWEARERQ